MAKEDEQSDLATVRSTSIIALLVGAWLIIAPYALSYNVTAAYWNEVILGIIVMIMALVRLSFPRMIWASWVNGLAGIWLIISPFFLGYHAVGYWNQIIFGIIVALLAYSNFGALPYHRPVHR